MEFITPGYEDLELSTQIIIKEAIKRDIDVEILDRNDNFIRLSRGDKIEYIKQATRTSADSYISPLIMENKVVTKKILAENNIRVPEGQSFDDINQAINVYDEYKNKKIVIKPNSTNFGKGVIILEKGYTKKEYADKRINLQKLDPSTYTLCYHSPKPMYGGDQPETHECKYVKGGVCYSGGSALNAEPLLDVLIRGGDEALWKELEKKYNDWFGEKENG